MTNAPEGAFKIPNFIDQLEPAKFGKPATRNYPVTGRINKSTESFSAQIYITACLQQRKQMP